MASMVVGRLDRVSELSECVLGSILAGIRSSKHRSGSVAVWQGTDKPGATRHEPSKGWWRAMAHDGAGELGIFRAGHASLAPHETYDSC